MFLKSFLTIPGLFTAADPWTMGGVVAGVRTLALGTPQICLVVPVVAAAL